MAEKKVFAAIKEIEVQIEASHKRRQQRQYELLQEYLRAREPLLQRRFEIVTGRSEPTDEELKGFKPQGAAAAAAASVAAASVALDVRTTSASSGGGGKVSPPRGVPFFWLNALCNEEKLAPLITPRDRCALEYLEDIRYVTGPMGLMLEFHFAPNPYFHNKVLRKGTYIKKRQSKAEDGNRAGSSATAATATSSSAVGVRGLDELMKDVESWRDEGTVIDWKPERSLLVRSEPEGRKVTAAPAAAPKTAAAAVGKKKVGGGGAMAGVAAATAGGGGKKGKKASVGGALSAVPSRSKRHHGKHWGPAPDLPEPEDDHEEAEEAEGEEEEEEQGAEEEAAAQPGSAIRRRPCPSFFRFFLPLSSGKLRQRKELDPTLEEDDQEDSEGEEDAEGEEDEDEAGGGDDAGDKTATAHKARLQQQRRVLDAEVLDVIVKKVVPRAAHLYLSGGRTVTPAASAPVVTAGKAKARAHAGACSGGEDDDVEEGFQLVSGSPAGDVASLALGAQKALHVLMIQQQQLDELAAELKRGEWEAWVAQMRQAEELTARRRTLLVGPTSNPGNKMSIPAFWLRALRVVPYGSLLVQHRDERALSYLTDVRLVWDTSRMPSLEDPHRKFDLELEFLPNPYFGNSVLRKNFMMHAPGGSLNSMWVASTKSDTIDWHPGRDLTVKLPPRGKHHSDEEEEEGGGGEGMKEGGPRRPPTGRAARPRKVPSFFAFFDDTPGALVRAFALPVRQSARALHEANQAQEAFLGELINVLVHFAGSLAEQSTVDVDDLGNEDDNDDDDEEEEDDDEEDDDEEEEDADEKGEGEEAAAARRARKAAAKAAARGRRRGSAGAGGAGAGDGAGNGLLQRLFGGGGGGGGGGSRGGMVLGIFVFVMLLAQVLVFLDTLDFVRSRFSWAP